MAPLQMYVWFFRGIFSKISRIMAFVPGVGAVGKEGVMLLKIKQIVFAACPKDDGDKCLNCCPILFKNAVFTTIFLYLV